MKKLLSGFLVALFAVSMAIIPSKALAADVYAYTDSVECGDTYVVTESIKKVNEGYQEAISVQVKRSIWRNGKFNWETGHYFFNKNSNGDWFVRNEKGWRPLRKTIRGGESTEENNVLYITLQYIDM